MQPQIKIIKNTNAKIPQSMYSYIAFTKYNESHDSSSLLVIPHYLIKIAILSIPSKILKIKIKKWDLSLIKDNN